MSGKIILRNFLVKRLRISNKDAVSRIVSGEVLVNGLPSVVGAEIRDTDEIRLGEVVIQQARRLVYFAFYKPRGIETTMSREIENNLHTVLEFDEKVFPAGRLDKESEGLLLLTNDGLLYEALVHSSRVKEKEYRVTVDKDLSEEVINRLSEGVEIMKKMTRPATVWKISEREFGIILTEGMNRQIRRMCYKCGYEVTQLIRTRIVNIEIGKMRAGELRSLNDEELTELKKLVGKV